MSGFFFLLYNHSIGSTLPCNFDSILRIVLLQLIYLQGFVCSNWSHMNDLWMLCNAVKMLLARQNKYSTKKSKSLYNMEDK